MKKDSTNLLRILGTEFFVARNGRSCSNVAVVTLRRTFAGRRKSTGRSGSLERKALEAAAPDRFLGAEGARVDAHPGDFGRQASIFDFRAAVHHHLDTVGLRERRRRIVANPKLH